MNSAWKTRPPYQRHQWAMQVAFAIIPLALFLLVIWVFIGDGRHSVGQITDICSVGRLDNPAVRLRAAMLNYSTHVYVHMIVCLVATCYFLMVMRNHARARSLAIRFEIGFAISFTLIAGAAVVTMTASQLLPTRWMIIWGLYIGPFEQLANALQLNDKLSGSFWGPPSFFHVLVLVPTFFGLMAVVSCTSAFHYVVCSRRSMKTDTWQDDVVRCATLLKRQLTFLSLALVTSVLTSKAYLYLLPNLVKDGSALKVYSDLASTLSFANSMLFTATLLAAFAPGVVSLLRDLSRLSADEKRGGLTAILERLNISKPSGQLSGIVRVVLTLAAPGLAGPLMDVVSMQ